MSAPNYSFVRNQRPYIAVQSDPLTLPTFVGANYCLFTKLTLDPIIAGIKRPDITGSRTDLPGIRGRMTGAWAFDLSMAGSGAAGTLPGIDPILQAAFGLAPVVVATTSCTYALSDNIITFALGRYRHSPNGAVALTNHIGMGCVVKDCTFTMGPDIATIAASGDCVFVLDSDNFGSYITAWKGGLSSFPIEPATPVQTSTPVIGFTGAITVDAETIVELKSATIKLTPNNQIVKDTFGTFIGSGTEGDMRTTAVSLILDDSDSAALIDIKQKAFTYAPINITCQVGTLPGNIFTFQFNNVQLENAKYTDGNRRMRFEIGESSAHGTTLAGLDAMTLTIT